MTALTKVLGNADAAPDLERRLHQPIPTVGGRSPAPDPAVSAQPVSSLLDQTTTRQEAIRTRTVPAASAPPTTHNTQVSAGTCKDRQRPTAPADQAAGATASNPAAARGAGSACCWCSQYC